MMLTVEAISLKIGTCILIDRVSPQISSNGLSTRRSCPRDACRVTPLSLLAINVWTPTIKALDPFAQTLPLLWIFFLAHKRRATSAISHVRSFADGRLTD